MAGPNAVTTLDAVWQALATVLDPELGLDVVSLGLVYEAAVEGGVAVVTHTLTTPQCPMGPIITRGIRQAVAGVPGIQTVQTRVVWDPRWNPDMIAPDAWEDRRRARSPERA